MVPRCKNYVKQPKRGDWHEWLSRIYLVTALIAEARQVGAWDKETKSKGLDSRETWFL